MGDRVIHRELPSSFDVREKHEFNVRPPEGLSQDLLEIRHMLMSHLDGTLRQASEERDQLLGILQENLASVFIEQFDRRLAIFAQHNQDVSRLAVAIREFDQGLYGPAIEQCRLQAEEWRNSATLDEIAPETRQVWAERFDGYIAIMENS